MQHLNRFMYRIGVARGQPKIKVPDSMLFAIPMGDSSNFLFKYREGKEHCLYRRSRKFNFEDCTVFSIGDTIYSIAPRNLGVTIITNTYKEAAIKQTPVLGKTEFDRRQFSIAVHTDFFMKVRVYLTGGKESNVPTDTCMYFDLDEKRWMLDDPVEQMSTPRFNHGSCIVRNNLYVVAGVSANGDAYISNIEFLYLLDRGFGWIVLTVPTALDPHPLHRESPVVCQISDYEFAIMGGMSRFARGLSSAVSIMNVIDNYTADLSRVIEEDQPEKFQALSPMQMRDAYGTVITPVKTTKERKLIKFSRD